MRLHVLGDLHLETAPFAPPVPDADVVVLAGDLHPGTDGVAWAAARWPDRPVVLVPGNHEFYGHAHPGLIATLEASAAASGAPVHVLGDRAVILHGVRFLGTTLWTDFALCGDPAASMATARRQMADFRQVRVEPHGDVAEPADTVRWHRRAVAWLREALAAPHDGPTVVVTHHAPSARSVNPRYTDPAAAAYASALDGLVAASGAALWVHGHTHHCVDYRVGGTRVLSNQRGYPGEAVGAFDPALVVAIAGGRAGACTGGGR